MGLDQYAYSCNKNAYDYECEVDFDVNNDYAINEIAYWRKHNALHGWMEELYRKKGGSAESFNCVNVNLTKEDILNLQTYSLCRILPETEGFFFGEDTRFDEYQREQTLKFCKNALIDLADGFKVYYTSWW